MPGAVHIDDDDESFLRAMKRRLSLAGYQVSTYCSAELLLDHISNEDRPSCILLDVRMPDLQGPEVQARLNEIGSTAPIIFVTGHADVPTSVKAIKAGAQDYLAKPVSAETLISIIEQALSRHATACEQREKDVAFRKRMARLTPREREVFERVVKGRLNKQIAHELGTTERTIKAHRHNVMEKMAVQSLAELVTLAGRIGAGGVN
jgi:FixJ family two-component response regulator